MSLHALQGGPHALEGTCQALSRLHNGLKNQEVSSASRSVMSRSSSPPASAKLSGASRMTQAGHKATRQHEPTTSNSHAECSETSFSDSSGALAHCLVTSLGHEIRYPPYWQSAGQPAQKRHAGIASVPKTQCLLRSTELLAACFSCSQHLPCKLRSRTLAS